MSSHGTNFLQAFGIPGDDFPVEAGGEERATEIGERLDSEGVISKGRAELPRR